MHDDSSHHLKQPLASSSTPIKHTYIIAVMCGATLSRIQAVQDFVACIVSGSSKCDHISPIFKDLKWLPVRQQLYYRHAIMAFKVQRTTVTKCTTKNSQMLNIPLYKTATGQRTF